jgi:hypothetical protein
VGSAQSPEVRELRKAELRPSRHLRFATGSRQNVASVVRVRLAKAVTIVYRRVLFLVYPLGTRDVPMHRPAIPVEVRPLAEADIAAYVRFRAADPIAVERRLQRGERCFASWYGGEIVDAGWIAAGLVEMPYLGCLLRLARGDIYHYDDYTAPQFRGAGLYLARNTFIARCMQREGFLRTVALVAKENYTAWILLSRAGMRTKGVYRFLRLGPWQRYWGHAVDGEELPVLCAVDGTAIPMHAPRVSAR